MSAVVVTARRVTLTSAVLAVLTAVAGCASDGGADTATPGPLRLEGHRWRVTELDSRSSRLVVPASLDAWLAFDHGRLVADDTVNRHGRMHYRRTSTGYVPLDHDGSFGWYVQPLNVRISEGMSWFLYGAPVTVAVTGRTARMTARGHVLVCVVVGDATHLPPARTHVP